MSDYCITKKALASSMKNLMEESPMKKISISDIVNSCNMNRQSFYYHFRDKYDLVNWIYYTEFVLPIRDLPLDKFDLLEKTCEYFYENKAFYVNAFAVTGQNSFSEYFSEITHSFLKHQLEEIFKNKANVNFYVTFYVDAIRISISRWLKEGTKIPPNEFVVLLKNAIENFSGYMVDA